MTLFEIAISIVATASCVFYGTLAVVSLLMHGKEDDL